MFICSKRKETLLLGRGLLETRKDGHIGWQKFNKGPVNCLWHYLVLVQFCIYFKPRNGPLKLLTGYIQIFFS